MKRFILNLSICLVIAMCSIAMIGCFGKTETPVETTTEETPAPTEEETAAPVEEGTETATEAPAAGEEG
ncbi:MAG: hypothetical protein V2A53_09745 [bacterium]